jgi:hypothetical protein
MHENRRPRRRLLPTSSRRAGEGLGRKARMNVTEESDSGVLSFGMYGGDDGARTRDLCRDSYANRLYLNDFMGVDG